MGKIGLAEVSAAAPLFRARLEFHEAAVDDLERKTTKIYGLFEMYSNLTAAMSNTEKDLANAVREYATVELIEEQNHAARDILQSLAAVLLQIDEHRQMCLAQSQSTVAALRAHLDTDFAGLRRARKTVERLQHENDVNTDRFFQCKQGDVAAMSTTANMMFSSRKLLHRRMCEYVQDLNQVQYRKRSVIMNKVRRSLISDARQRCPQLHEHVSSQSTFHKLVHATYRSAEPLMERLFEQSSKAAADAALSSKEDTEELHRIVADADAQLNEQLVRFQTRDLSRQNNSPDVTALSLPSVASAPEKTGKRGWVYMSERRAAAAGGTGGASGPGAAGNVAAASAAVGTYVLHPSYWIKSYAMVVDTLLYAQSADPHDVPWPVANLLLCTVKPISDIDRNFVFTVISPTRTLLIQAESSEEMYAWIAAIQAAIASALQGQHAGPSASSSGSLVVGDDAPVSRARSHSSLAKFTSGAVAGDGDDDASVRARLAALRAVPGNALCADCGAPDPEWASINLGILLCIECSGIHRSLGVHISQVRSLELDRWRPEWVQTLHDIGNENSKRRYEARAPADKSRRIGPTAERKAREAWIRAKYVDMEFVEDQAQVVRKQSSSLKPPKTEEEWLSIESGSPGEEEEGRRRSLSASGSRIARFVRSIKSNQNH